MPYCWSKPYSAELMELALCAPNARTFGFVSVWKDIDRGGCMVRPRPACSEGLTSLMESLRPERDRGGGALPMCEERDED